MFSINAASIKNSLTKSNAVSLGLYSPWFELTGNGGLLYVIFKL